MLVGTDEAGGGEVALDCIDADQAGSKNCACLKIQAAVDPIHIGVGAKSDCLALRNATDLFTKPDSKFPLICNQNCAVNLPTCTFRTTRLLGRGAKSV